MTTNTIIFMSKRVATLVMANAQNFSAAAGMDKPLRQQSKRKRSIAICCSRIRACVCDCKCNAIRFYQTRQMNLVCNEERQRERLSTRSQNQVTDRVWQQVPQSFLMKCMPSVLPGR